MKEPLRSGWTGSQEAWKGPLVGWLISKVSDLETEQKLLWNIFYV